MATTNGVILEVPYAIIRNIRNQRPWTLAIVGRDPRPSAYNQQQLRAFPSTISQASSGVLFYTGDVITFNLQAPCNDAAAPAFDIVFHDPDTGLDASPITIYFSAIWQRNIVVTITGFSSINGEPSYTIVRS